MLGAVVVVVEPIMNNSMLSGIVPAYDGEISSVIK